MRKFFVLISIILLAAAAVAAQTGPKTETARPGRSTEGERKTSAGGKKIRARGTGVLRLGPPTTYLKNGLSAGDVVKVLGQPVSVSERLDGDLRLATYTFARGEGRVLVAEFENGVLVGSRARTGETLVQSGESGQ
jgi:hypothetical protein